MFVCFVFFFFLRWGRLGCFGIGIIQTTLPIPGGRVIDRLDLSLFNQLVSVKVTN